MTRLKLWFFTVTWFTIGGAAPAQTPLASEGKARPKTVTYVVAPTGNEARYRVREQLAGFDLPNDAVGATRDVHGSVVLDTTGNGMVRDGSRIVVTLTGLKSDQARRDAFLRRRTMEIDQFPTVEIALKSLRGLTGRPWVSRAPETTFEMLADLTVRRVTRPTTWTVTARGEGGDIVGTAKTAFTFDDFELDQPRVPIVLSVADTIRLEYDFRLTPAARQGSSE